MKERNEQQKWLVLELVHCKCLFGYYNNIIAISELFLLSTVCSLNFPFVLMAILMDSRAFVTRTARITFDTLTIDVLKLFMNDTRANDNNDK